MNFSINNIGIVLIILDLMDMCRFALTVFKNTQAF